jgi:hypothetical protein
MPPLVVAGAMMTCTFGVAPCPLVPIPVGIPVLVGGLPAATIMDFKPLANIATFGMCNTITNPVVAAATAAKLGVFSPAPCVPATAAPWAPPATVLIGGVPALTASAKCLCSWGGVISITTPGNFTVEGN